MNIDNESIRFAYYLNGSVKSTLKNLRNAIDEKGKEQYFVEFDFWLDIIRRELEKTSDADRARIYNAAIALASEIAACAIQEGDREAAQELWQATKEPKQGM